MSNDQIKINYFGYFTPYGGYGIANLNWITYLTRLGVDVSCHKKFSYAPGSPEYEVLSKEQLQILDKPFEKRKVGIIETTPFDFGIIESDFKIANTMCESDRIGKPWVDACNGMDLIVVPNEWNKQVFESSGVVRPIEIIRHGTWTEMYPYYDRPKRDVFTFGIVGWLDNRKGVFDVIRAFSSEFSPEEPVQLYLKSSSKDFGYYSHFHDKRIRTDIHHLSPDLLRELYYSFDAFVFPSKAEGVGQPPREAMSTGLPVILTDYSGLHEVADPRYSYPLQPKEFLSRVDWTEQPGQWAQIDIQELMATMRYVYEHQAEAKEKGRMASEVIHREHSWEFCAGKMVDLLQGVI